MATSTSSPTVPPDQNAALNQVLTYLSAKDDTSRFVGLTVLQKLLDSNESLRTNSEVVSKCYNAIPTKFLARLLQATQSDKTSLEEANSMNQLAVAIINIFAILLPAEKLADQKTVSLVGPLAAGLHRHSDEARTLALQALLSIASNEPGAKAIFRSEARSFIVEEARREEVAVQVVGRVLSLVRRSGDINTKEDLRLWENSLGRVVCGCETKEKSAVMELCTDVLRNFEDISTVSWLPFAITVIQETVIQRPTARARKASILLAATLLQHAPSSTKVLSTLFHPSTKLDPDRKFPNFFTNLLLIDIRATIPSLMEKLASDTYLDAAVRLAACYDLLGAFIHCLIYSLSDVEEEVVESTPKLMLPPDTLLRLRKDISETLSMTIEFIRDRWDAAFSGTAGLHPDAIPTPHRPVVDDKGEPKQLALTWDNPSIEPKNDPILISSLRTLALWLRDDDNEALQREATGIVDVLLALYAIQSDVDFKDPVLIILDTLTASQSDAAESFVQHKGWELLASDLHTSTTNHERMRSVIRVLLNVLESETTSQPPQSWLALIPFFSTLYADAVTQISVEEEELETLLACWELSLAMLSKASKKARHDNSVHLGKIETRVKKMLKEKSQLRHEDVEGLDEVLSGIEGLKL